jgi:hypothetical protein
MNVIELRHQITEWLDQLSSEHLELVASFVDFLHQKQLQGVGISQHNHSKAIQTEMSEAIAVDDSGVQGSMLADLLEFAGAWEGDDLRECLKLVREQRAPVEL